MDVMSMPWLWIAAAIDREGVFFNALDVVIHTGGQRQDRGDTDDAEIPAKEVISVRPFFVMRLLKDNAIAVRTTSKS